MAWRVLRTETAVDSDGRNWEIDLLGGETKIETPPVGRVLHGLVASAHLGEQWRFKVSIWVPEDQVEVAQRRVMAEARRRVEQGDWQAGEEY
jgi:hypothetical protein